MYVLVILRGAVVINLAAAVIHSPDSHRQQENSKRREQEENAFGVFGCRTSSPLKSVHKSALEGRRSPVDESIGGRLLTKGITGRGGEERCYATYFSQRWLKVRAESSRAFTP